jgi:hypothetical protein
VGNKYDSRVADRRDWSKELWRTGINVPVHSTRLHVTFLDIWMGYLGDRKATSTFIVHLPEPRPCSEIDRIIKEAFEKA